MNMLYNSDSFAVVQFDVPADGVADGAGELRRGGYEIVDKFAGKEIYIEGALAESFKLGVQALIDRSTTIEELDAYIGRYTPLMQQPLVLH
jgi:Protein of unknown function (DUF3567)